MVGGIIRPVKGILTPKEEWGTSKLNTSITKEFTVLDTKKKAFSLYLRGIWNRPRIWNSYEEILACGYRGNVTMRYLIEAKGARVPFIAFQVPIKDIPKVEQEWISRCADIRMITFNESAPDHRLILQGEVQQSINHLDLTYSREKTNMRKAMENPLTIKGISALLLLKQHADPKSLGTMLSLLRQFQDHVIEFGIYSVNLGCIPHRNTIIWEVRKY